MNTTESTNTNIFKISSPVRKVDTHSNIVTGNLSKVDTSGIPVLALHPHPETANKNLRTVNSLGIPVLTLDTHPDTTTRWYIGYTCTEILIPTQPIES